MGMWAQFAAATPYSVRPDPLPSWSSPEREGI